MSVPTRSARRIHLVISQKGVRSLNFRLNWDLKNNGDMVYFDGFLRRESGVVDTGVRDPTGPRYVEASS